MYIDLLKFGKFTRIRQNFQFYGNEGTRIRNCMIKGLNIIDSICMDYQWSPHCKCITNLSYKEIGRKMATAGLLWYASIASKR